MRVLTNSLDKESRGLVDRSLENIEHIPGPRLREISKEFSKALREVISHYGVVATLAELEATLDPSRSHWSPDEDVYWCVSKYELRKLFTRYENALPAFEKLPPHARVGIDCKGIRHSAKSMEVFWLEAALFEDMAAQWNEAVVADNRAAKPESTKQELKHAHSCTRSAAKGAFNLLEGYINGVAGDILLLQHVSDEERTLLEEWDTLKKRPRFVTLRDKLLQYPRIASGAKHAPIQETSSGAMRRVLDLEKQLRHALIHPRPQVYMDELRTFREIIFFELTNQVVGALCDDVLTLIEEISRVVGPRFGDVSFWITKRDSEGLFPDSAFD